MRAIFIVSAACALLASAAQVTASAAALVPASADAAALMQIEAIQDRSAEDSGPPGQSTQDLAADTWQGRQHYLYDDNQPGPATVGSSAADARACVARTVRVRRPDGSTGLQRLNTCD